MMIQNHADNEVRSIHIVIKTHSRDQEPPDRGLEGGHDNPIEQPTHKVENNNEGP